MKWHRDRKIRAKIEESIRDVEQLEYVIEAHMSGESLLYLRELTDELKKCFTGWIRLEKKRRIKLRRKIKKIIAKLEEILNKEHQAGCIEVLRSHWCEWEKKITSATVRADIEQIKALLAQKEAELAYYLKLEAFEAQQEEPTSDRVNAHG